MKRFMLLVVLVLILSASSFATVFVKWNSPYDGPGDNWDDAYHSVQAGINAATSGEEVWVAGDSAHPYLEHIVLPTGLGLYGGFAGTETSRDQRDPSANVTILDGSSSGRVVTYAPGPSGGGILEGFTIRNGKAAVGGGIYCSGASPTFSNDTISGNVATTIYGGGIYCLNSSPTITRCVISRNTAENGNSGPVYTTEGGGIYCSGGSPQIMSNTICSNRANIHNPFYYGGVGQGGGLYISGVDDASTVANNVIIANSANHGAGCGIYLSNCSPRVVSNTIVCNAGGYAVSCGGSQSPISNNIIAFNTSGIGILSAGPPVLRNNCVYNPDGTNYSGVSAGTGDISIDPRLTAPELNEVHLQTQTPCINAGWNDAPGLTSVDIDGDPRILVVTTDIGADEYAGNQPPYVRPVVRVSPSGDDSDGSTWAHAKKTVAGAIGLLPNGGEVWVAMGTYYNEHVAVSGNVYLYGGFAGSETVRDQRNWEKNTTILDGQSPSPPPGDRLNAEKTILTDGQAGGTVVTFSSINGYRMCGIDGFTIRHGTGTSYTMGLYGGGIYSNYACPSITHNELTSNYADLGAGIGSVSSFLYVSENLITLNTAFSQGGGLCASGMSDGLIYRNEFIKNQAGSSGGGICYFGNGNYTIADNLFRSNTAGNGGALYTYLGGFQGEIHLICNNLIIRNSAGYMGSAIYHSVQGGMVSNNTIYGNTNTSYPKGGAIYFNAGVFCNNIVAYNSSEIGNGGNTTWRNNDFYMNPNILALALPPIGTNGNISVDPQFLAPWVDDFRLRPGSPCINTGSDSDAPAWPDLDGNTRIIGAHVDMGCLEWDSLPYWIHKISTAKAMPAAFPVTLKSKPVTMVGLTPSVSSTPADFCIEEPDRSSGIRVMFSANLSPGDIVTVTGQMALSSCERVLNASAVTVESHDDLAIPAPLVIPSRYLGGGDYQYTADYGQQGITGGSGLNNIGLMVKIVGRVTQAGNGILYVDDGSALKDGTSTSGVPNVGVRVMVKEPNDIQVGDFVIVKGISSCIQYNGVIRLVFTSGPGDVQKVPE